ncbi:hypothetical protein V5J35_000069 [Endozoicomonas sp. NE40]|uniref:Uncharacterized protein n=3 Tax=Endozoicomonas lisbonensis TaxID=3120522 RepID=A0ABV2SAV3_9GAMM
MSLASNKSVRSFVLCALCFYNGSGHARFSGAMLMTGTPGGDYLIQRKPIHLPGMQYPNGGVSSERPEPAGSMVNPQGAARKTEPEKKSLQDLCEDLLKNPAHAWVKRREDYRRIVEAALKNSYDTETGRATWLSYFTRGLVDHAVSESTEYTAIAGHLKHSDAGNLLLIANNFIQKQRFEEVQVRLGQHNPVQKFRFKTWKATAPTLKEVTSKIPEDILQFICELARGEPSQQQLKKLFESAIAPANSDLSDFSSENIESLQGVYSEIKYLGLLPDDILAYFYAFFARF